MDGMTNCLIGAFLAMWLLAAAANENANVADS